MGKGLGKTVLGWFVVDESEAKEEIPPAAQTAEELVAKYAKSPEPSPRGAPPAAPPNELSIAQSGAATAWSTSTPAVQFAAEPPKAAGAAVDFKGVYVAAGITGDEQERVEKAIALVGTLPKETPLEVKKQIVEASLKAFGIPVDEIIEAGAQQIQALEGYIQLGERDTQTVLSESSTRIAELSAEIETIRGLMAQQVAEQQGLAGTCNHEKLRVQAVLEFFGQEAIARVVKESPKLVEPS